QGVLLQRNVGYKSIGHGFYLESGTETDNKFYSNLGIFARAAAVNPQNPRALPGILAYSGQFFKSYYDPIKKVDITAALPDTAFPWRSDYMFPTVFWITNGWNDFIGNMAAGAGACGASYWLVPAWNTDMPDVRTSSNTQFNTHMKWNGFASLQKDLSLAGSTPLKSFYGNFATSTMTSFQTVGQTSPCPGATWPKDPAAGNPGIFPGVTSFAPTPEAPANTEADMYYPHVSGGGRMATMCPLKVEGDPSKGYDCTLFTSGQRSSCNNGDPLKNCAVTVLDHFTSSFHWAQTNFAAIWLRPQWYLVDNSVLTDVQNGGLSFITSGTYDRSAVVDGDWAVVRTSVFIGNTQKEGTNSYASNLTPFQHTFKENDGLPCQNGRQPSLMCANANEGVSLPIDNFAVGQRLFNIYDGPAYQESNIYLDTSTAECKECVYSRMPGIRKQTNSDKSVSCYLPNAAIGWKQPNGFFYPPSFHSTNLFFDKVEIRHYVIDALFKVGSYNDDTTQIMNDYCDFSGIFPNFGNFSDIDRQTELNDDDGSLTGLTNDVKVQTKDQPPTTESKPTGTISVNPVEFFRAPVETAECLSNRGVTPDKACPISNPKPPPPFVLPATPTPAGANTSPYDYVTTVVFPELCKGAFPAAGTPRKCGDDNDNVGGVVEVGGIKYTRWTKLLGRAGDWSAECTNPACYGVPLYRQLLTGTSASRELKDWNATCGTIELRKKNQKDCRWPFVRMGGQSTYQRSSLTVNHGTYFIDTSVSNDTQTKKEAFTTTKPCNDPSVPAAADCSPRSVNVFLKGQTYDVFFLFAKPATKQTYQIYVGSTGFNLANDVGAIRPVLDTMPMPSIESVTPWPTNWTKNYNDKVACATFLKPDKTIDTSCGILQVTVDFSAQTDLDPKSQCLPANFCVKSGSTCGCSLKASDPLALADPVRMDASGKNVLFGGILGACQKTCSQWAVKDLDFPGKGPLGFSFKMATDPDDQGYLHRPVPQPFPTTRDRDPKKFDQPDPDWLTMFATTAVQPDKSTGECHYSSIPTNGPGACQIP
ncbi:MAG TPA: hypothetical protein VLA85_12725, partial [Verrucomicrobiae bacterium]|nr:hypothetical protein [Verrucomicrobiae bacterium]